MLRLAVKGVRQSGRQAVRLLWTSSLLVFVMELGLRPYLTGRVEGKERKRVRLANEGKLWLRMLLAIYEKSQINQTNNENTPTKRRLGKKETSKGGRVKWQQEGSWAEGVGMRGRVAKLMQSFLNEKIYDGNTQN